VAASASDKFRKTYSFLQKTISDSGGIDDNDTTLTPNNITDIPTDTGVSFIVDRVDSNGNLTPSKRELMTGRINGSTITDLVRGQHGTTAQAHAQGAVIEFVNSGALWNDLIDGLLTTLDQTGAIKTNGITSAAQITNDIITNSEMATAVKPVTLFDETTFDFVASGGVWSGDSYGSTRAASMTSGVVYINGARLTLSSVSARTFTASKDTYVDLSDNGDGTAAITYTEVSNNAASPALASNSLRLAIIVTGASSIADAGSVNQGQENKVLPIASSVPYAVTDSLGNLICPRDPQRQIIGFRQLVAYFSSGTTAETKVTGLDMPIKIPTGRKIRLSLHNTSVGSTGIVTLKMYEGVFGSGGTAIQQTNVKSDNNGVFFEHTYTPTSTSLTFTLTVQSTSGNPTFSGGTSTPCIFKAELT